MPIPAARPARRRPAGPTLQDKINQFFLAEKVAAVAIDRGSDQSIVTAGGMENLTSMTQRTDGGHRVRQRSGSARQPERPARRWCRR